MRRKVAQVAAVLMGIALVGVLAAIWIDRQALGLAGRGTGTRLNYEIVTHVPPALDQSQRMASALEQRARELLGQPVQFRAAGPTRIEVLVPASVPLADVKRVLQFGSMLEFCFIVEEPQLYSARAKQLREQGPESRLDDPASSGTAWFQVNPSDRIGWQTESRDGKEWLLVYTTPDKAMMHGRDFKPWGLRRATADYDRTTGRQIVEFEFDSAGAALFGELTAANLKRPLAILLDGQVLSVPIVQSRIEDRGQITGDFKNQQIQAMARSLDAGVLPGRLPDQPISESETEIVWPMSRLAVVLIAMAAILAITTIVLLIYGARAAVAPEEPAS